MEKSSNTWNRKILKSELWYKWLLLIVKSSHRMHQVRLLCPSLSPRVCSNPCPVSQWCYLMISCSAALCSFCPQSLPAFLMNWLFASGSQGSFSFSISPSSDYSGLIPFRIDWFDRLAVQGHLESSPAPQFESIIVLALSLLYGATLSSVHDYWKNHSFY